MMDKAMGLYVAGGSVGQHVAADLWERSGAKAHSSKPESVWIKAFSQRRRAHDMKVAGDATTAAAGEGGGGTGVQEGNPANKAKKAKEAKAPRQAPARKAPAKVKRADGRGAAGEFVKGGSRARVDKSATGLGAQLGKEDRAARRKGQRATNAKNRGTELEFTEYCKAHIYAANRLETEWHALLDKAKRVKTAGGEGGRQRGATRRDKLWDEIVKATRSKFPDINWLNEATMKPQWRSFPTRLFQLRAMERHLAKPEVDGKRRADTPPSRPGQSANLPRAVANMVTATSNGAPDQNRLPPAASFHVTVVDVGW